MKPTTSLSEPTTDYIGIYKPIYENQDGNVRHAIEEHENNNIVTTSKPTNVKLTINENEDQSDDIPSVFSELLTLHENEWREAARWIKFEETVENGGNRWSKPYVGTLSLPSLHQLKKLLQNGQIILNVEALNMDAIVKLIGEELVSVGALSAEERDMFKSLLLQPHRHQHEFSSKSNKTKSENNSKGELILNPKNIDVQNGNKRFLRKIPPGAEACNIFVGEVEWLSKSLTIFIRLKEAKLLKRITEVSVPTRFLFILLSPKNTNHFEIGRAMATLMADEEFRFNAYHARDTEFLITGIDDFLNDALILPPAEWDSSIRLEPPLNISPSKRKRSRSNRTQNSIDKVENPAQQRGEAGLVYSGRLFGGLFNDIKRKTPWYWCDFKDALNMQCLASWIFLYFACLSPIITFGGLLSEATGKNIAAIESLVSGLICGIGYGLFSGQPLAILGSTGPVLVFESIVYDFCINQGWDYLTFRFWIGTWIAIILLIMTAFDASAAVCYITRFTEENFATLIAFIFIFKAIENVISIGSKYPVNNPINNCICTPFPGSNDTILDYAKYDRTSCLLNNGSLVGSDCDKPETVNVFLMSIILFLGTFLISIILKEFKNALFFPTCVRQFVSDFAVIIAIFAMSTMDFLMQVATPKLEVPADLKPTLQTRSWLITPFHEENPTWTAFAAIVPALLGTILIFMDQQITAVIINRRENKLKKGCGYHLDLFILSILIQICSVMGLPWFVAATVLSLNHVNSLRKESESSAPGEKPQFLGVHEQRVTQILIFLTIGLSVFLTPLLRHIPMPVLFGVFLYMGVASLKGLQLYERILIMFMPPKYQPDYPYLRQIPIRRVHLFTLIQLACLMALWILKSFSQTSILFPLMLVVMIGIRKMLDNFFTQQELKILDDLMPGKSVCKATKQTEAIENNSKTNQFI